MMVMIDVGYNYDRLREKMGWLDIDPAGINHILITHQDTDHVGAVERDSDHLFTDATLYIGEMENRYLTGEVRYFYPPDIKHFDPHYNNEHPGYFADRSIKIRHFFNQFF